jgi:hypothetical protein
MKNRSRGFCKKHDFLFLECRVARCFIVLPKLPFFVSFGRPWNGHVWHSSWSFVVFCR